MVFAQILIASNEESTALAIGHRTARNVNVGDSSAINQLVTFLEMTGSNFGKRQSNDYSSREIWLGSGLKAREIKRADTVTRFLR